MIDVPCFYVNLELFNEELVFLNLFILALETNKKEKAEHNRSAFFLYQRRTLTLSCFTVLQY